MALKGAAKAAWRKSRADKGRAEKRAHDARAREKRRLEILGMSDLGRARAYLAQSPYCQMIQSIVAKALRDACGVVQHTMTRDQKERSNATYRRYGAKLRDDAIWLLGGKCECCGMDEPAVLQFDHRSAVKRRTNGVRARDAATSAREIINGGARLYMLLCANCHVLKTRANGEYGHRHVDVFGPVTRSLVVLCTDDVVV